MPKRTPLTKKSEEELERTKAFSIPKFSQPVSLDKYFEEYIDNIHECLFFLRRFADEDENIGRLINAYNSNKDKFTSKFSLDLLAETAQIDSNTFRRLIISTMDYLCSDEADMAIRLSKASLVRKSIEKAMGDDPESYGERQKWLEFMGYRAVNKNTQLINVNVNSNNQQNTTNTQQNLIVNGLPSISSTITEAEKIGNETIKSLIAAQNKENIIDIVPEKEKIENV